jgi:hypothetical protein
VRAPEDVSADHGDRTPRGWGTACGIVDGRRRCRRIRSATRTSTRRRRSGAPPGSATAAISGQKVSGVRRTRTRAPSRSHPGPPPRVPGTGRCRQVAHQRIHRYRVRKRLEYQFSFNGHDTPASSANPLIYETHVRPNQSATRSTPKKPRATEVAQRRLARLPTGPNPPNSPIEDLMHFGNPPTHVYAPAQPRSRLASAQTHAVTCVRVAHHMRTKTAILQCLATTES